MRNNNKDSEDDIKLIKYYEIKLDINKKLYNDLIEYGKRHILDDEKELINYAVCDIIKKSFEDSQIKKMIKKSKMVINRIRNGGNTNANKSND